MTKVNEAKENCVLNNLIQKYMANNPEKRRTEKECQMMNKTTMGTLDYMIIPNFDNDKKKSRVLPKTICPTRKTIPRVSKKRCSIITEENKGHLSDYSIITKKNFGEIYEGNHLSEENLKCILCTNQGIVKEFSKHQVNTIPTLRDKLNSDSLNNKKISQMCLYNKMIHNIISKHIKYKNGIIIVIKIVKNEKIQLYYDSDICIDCAGKIWNEYLENKYIR